MKKSKFTESQIIKILKGNEQGRSIPELARELGVDKSTIYYWRKKYGGMEAKDLKRIVKKVLRPSDKRLLVKYLIAYYKVSISRACAVISLTRSMWYYQNKKNDSKVIDKLTALSQTLPTN